MAKINKYDRKKDVSTELFLASGPVKSRVNNKINVISGMRVRVANAIKTGKQLPIFHNLMPIVCSMEILQLSYSNIKSNSGSMTPGTQNQTADEMSKERLQKLSTELKSGTYKFPDVRRTWLSKPGKNVDWSKKDNLVQFGRPLGMPDFDAKVVQEAVRFVLNAIYEPIFDKAGVSYGFRPQKGCQDTLYKIPPRTQGMSTVIEGDIKGAFNNLNHEKLIGILSRRIQDDKFLALIYNMCRAGIFDQLQNIRTDSLLGVPQGGIASPILWNIYMHEFDRFVLTEIKDLIDMLNVRQKRIAVSIGSPQYKKCMYQMAYHMKAYLSLTKNLRTSIKDLHPKEREKALNSLTLYKHYKKRSLTTPSKRLDRLPIRMEYVRYADDWVLFTNAKPVLAQLFKNKLAAFLKDYLNLTLSLEKTKITNLKGNGANFLGCSIKVPTPKIAYTRAGVAKRVTGQKVYIGVDKERLINRMEWNGYHKKLKPREQPAWSVLSDFEIIGKYNSVIRGLINYYAPIIKMRSTLNHYVYILEYSCYKTLCQKHRTSIRKLLKKHAKNGKALTANFLNKKGEERQIELLTCKTYWSQLKQTSESIKQALESKTIDQGLLASSDFLNNAKGYWRTAFKMYGRCVVCGSKEHVEMHHIKHVRKFGKKESTGFIRIMNLLNRKQIPVCRFHHQAIHDGNYDNISLSDLYDTRIATVENYLKLN